MSVAVDTNVIVDLVAGEPGCAQAARRALQAAHGQGAIVLCPVVYTELLAYPGRAEAGVEAIVQAMGARVDWVLPKAVWLDAGRAFGAYAQRRRREGEPAPRRVLADFVIGAHAVTVGALLTRDWRLYRQVYPDLPLIRPE